mgnify:CR=1 FL=1
MHNDYFDLNCQKCPRLAAFLCDVKEKNPTYHAKPVAPFGDENARLLIVGLAPGMHGANATGRPFTGDFAGILLYEALHEFGFSNCSESTSLNDGLVLKNARITNAVKCLPPQNKPTGEEITLCNTFLSAELRALPENAVILALGSIAHQAVLKAYNLKSTSAKFAHNNCFEFENKKTLVSSYHTSRYNIQTKRLTKSMFTDVFKTIASLLTRS